MCLFLLVIEPLLLSFCLDGARVAEVVWEAYCPSFLWFGDLDSLLEYIS